MKKHLGALGALKRARHPITNFLFTTKHTQFSKAKRVHQCQCQFYHFQFLSVNNLIWLLEEKSHVNVFSVSLYVVLFLSWLYSKQKMKIKILRWQSCDIFACLIWRCVVRHFLPLKQGIYLYPLTQDAVNIYLCVSEGETQYAQYK